MLCPAQGQIPGQRRNIAKFATVALAGGQSKLMKTAAYWATGQECDWSREKRKTPDCLGASWTKRGNMIASAAISHVTLEMLRFGAAALTVSDCIIYEESIIRHKLPLLSCKDANVCKLPIVHLVS